MTEPRKILIIRLSSLGDILHALPAFECLRQTFRGAEIDWLVEKRMQFFLSAVGGVDRVLTIDTRTPRNSPLDFATHRANLRLIREIRSRRYDICLDFQGLLKTAALSVASGARTRIGFPGELIRERPAHWFYHRHAHGPGRPVHITVLNQMLAAETGARPLSPAPALSFHISESDRRAVETRLRNEELTDFIVINPGGGWYTKRWSPAKYGILAARIQNELKLQVAVTTGPGEESLYREIALHCIERPPVNLPISFLQLIPLFEKARLLVGGDTGPFHLACALGVPVVGIFGPTLPVRNGPWDSRDGVVVHELPCSYCNGRTCPTRNECMDISVDEVIEAIASRLEKTH